VEVVVASRVRLARNLSDVPFRGVLPPGAAREFCEHVRQKLSDLPLDFFADDTSP